MKNKRAGTCYRCGGHVDEGAGFFERAGPPHESKWPGQPLPKWLLQHVACQAKWQGTDRHYKFNPIAEVRKR